MRLVEVEENTLEKIKEAEEKGEYHKHLDPTPVDTFFPIDHSFSYDKPWYIRIGYFFLRSLLVAPYAFIVNHFWFKTEVIGRYKLRHIPGAAIITCNHINKLDSLSIGYALKGKKIHYTTAEFNNLKGRLGAYMRAYGCMPIPSHSSYLSYFQDQLKKYLEKGDWVSFFPECAEWWCYEKPRPYQIGAFHYAAKFHVPIVPIFITFTKMNKYYKNGIEKRKFIVHILDPIFPKHGMSLKENKEEMRRKNEELAWKCYHNFYKV